MTPREVLEREADRLDFKANNLRDRFSWSVMANEAQEVAEAIRAVLAEQVETDKAALSQAEELHKVRAERDALRTEVERLRAELDRPKHQTLRQLADAIERHDWQKARAERAEAALRLALDALTDAEQYHGRACAKDQPHDHPLLRKLRATVPACDAALRDTAPDEEGKL
jgi:DNA repair exonuclease SbcCD ATPase subunit